MNHRTLNRRYTNRPYAAFWILTGGVLVLLVAYFTRTTSVEDRLLDAGFVVQYGTKCPGLLRKVPVLGDFLEGTFFPKRIYGALSHLGAMVPGFGSGSHDPEMAPEMMGRRISDDSLQLLKDVDTLERIDLSYSLVTDWGLAHLVGLENLEELNLSRTAVTDRGLRHLASLKNLTVLELHHTQVSQAGRKDLKEKIPTLQIRFSSSN